MTDPGYEEIKPWGGHRRWQCMLGCGFNSTTERVVIEHVEKYHRLACDHKGCAFVTTDPYEAKEHGKIHSDTIVLTDSYGRAID